VVAEAEDPAIFYFKGCHWTWPSVSRQQNSAAHLHKIRTKSTALTSSFGNK